MKNQCLMAPVLGTENWLWSQILPYRSPLTGEPFLSTKLSLWGWTPAFILAKLLSCVALGK